ncbi:MAG: flp pilus-assembly TadE/G-like family protein [Actinomycetaceae bacterium]|nr:flp pilus-assembly TadE/G-like family protein [Actinomycetaceae bacterium]
MRSCGRARTRWRRPVEDGSGTVLALSLVAAIVVGILFTAALSNVAFAHAKAQNAADFAALAAASWEQLEGDGCKTAGGIAKRNGADLTSCRIRDEDALVTVSVRPRVLGLLWQVSAHSRAGPVSP